MKRDITRAIIDATIDRGLREIYEDPRRSIRKFAELGRQFNNGRFTKNLYDIFHDLLRNDESPYYTAIEHLLQFTDRKKLRDFGINIGYESFARGGKLIRALNTKNGFHVPWNLIIRLNSKASTPILPSDLITFVAQGKKLGIYTYTIRLEGNLDYFEDLLKLFITYDDCAFFFILPDCEIDTDNIPLISHCSNVIFFLPAFGDNYGYNLRLFRKEKAWIGIYAYYGISDSDLIISDSSVWEYIPQESSFLLLISKDDVPIAHIKKTSQRIKKMRLTPVVPLFIFDLYGDLMQIQELISGKDYFYEIFGNGRIITEHGNLTLNDGLPDLNTLFSCHQN